MPFGEYVPLKSLLPFVEKMVVGVGDFSSGKNFTLFWIQRLDLAFLSAMRLFFRAYPELL